MSCRSKEFTTKYRFGADLTVLVFAEFIVDLNNGSILKRLLEESKEIPMDRGNEVAYKEVHVMIKIAAGMERTASPKPRSAHPRRFGR